MHSLTMRRHIILTGIKAPETVRSSFASGLVDIAGVSEISHGWARVEVEEDIDLSNPGDRDWVVNLIRQELESCGESAAKIEIV
jgi:hypothetical protein